MENSYLQYGHFVPTPEIMNQLQTLGISVYHPWMPNAFVVHHGEQQVYPSSHGEQAHPSSSSTIVPSSMNHDMDTGKNMIRCLRRKYMDLSSCHFLFGTVLYYYDSEN